MSTYGDCNGSEYEFNPYVTTLGHCAQSPFISFNPLISKWRKTNARRARCYGDVSRWRRFGFGDAQVPHEHTKHPMNQLGSVFFVDAINAITTISFPGSLFSASIVDDNGGREERPWERGCNNHWKNVYDQICSTFNKNRSFQKYFSSIK